MDNIDQLNSTINDSDISNLIEHANDIKTLLQAPQLNGIVYKDIIKSSSDLERILYAPLKLQEYVDNPAKFDKAIQLLELVNELYKNHSHQVPILDGIHRQTESQRDYLTANLCNRLDDFKDATKEELRFVVNKLVRCGNFTGRELRLRFLQARDNWFNNECEYRSDSFDELISFFCKGLPQIFDEYKTIFGDACSLANSKLMSFSTSDPMREDGAIINSWLLLKTSTFILSLEVHLSSVSKSKFLTPTMISDTMSKCFRLTDWLASIGFDFSAQLRPLFSRAILEEVRYNIEKITAKFETDFTKIISKSIESLLLPVEDEILRISNMTKPEEQLPKSIGHYPVFRIYCLYLIDSLRWIQTTKGILSPISLCLDTYASLNASLTRIVKALAVVLNMDNNSNHPILSKIAIAFLTEVLPFFTTYCEFLFPEKVILNSIGISKTEFKSLCSGDQAEMMKNFHLNLRQIAEPLRGTMPALMQTIEG